MPQMGDSDLPKDLKEAPPVILSVLEVFKITQRFVAGVDDYHPPNRAQMTSGSFGRFTTEWVAFLDVSCSSSFTTSIGT